MPHLFHSFCQPQGGLAHEATIFYKHLASLLSTKWGIVILLLWAGLSFSLLCSVIACICGARLSSGHFDTAPSPMDLTW